MTWTNDPSLIQKKAYRSSWLTLMPVFPFFTSTVWPPHALLLSKVRIRFKVCELCSPLSVVIYLFYSSSIGSKFRTKSWSVLFSSSSIDLHSCSFWPFSGLQSACFTSFSFGDRYPIHWHFCFLSARLFWGFSLLPGHVHPCPWRVFQSGWPIWFFKFQPSTFD